MLSGETINANFIVFGLTRMGLEPTRGKLVLFKIINTLFRKCKFKYEYNVCLVQEIADTTPRERAGKLLVKKGKFTVGKLSYILRVSLPSLSISYICNTCIQDTNLSLSVVFLMSFSLGYIVA